MKNQTTELFQHYLNHYQTINQADLFQGAFPEQIAAITDPARLKMFFCTRRAAKSYTAGLYLTKEALEHDFCNTLYLGLTRQSAKDIIWKDVMGDINRRFKLGLHPHLTELSLTAPNGSIISVTGVDADENEMNKLLGRKYRLVVIDEASLYTVDLIKLVYGILKPAMSDQGGTIVLSGTSSNFARGLFYEVTRMLNGQTKGVFKCKDWSVHAWTTHDNPYNARQWQEELDEIERDRPLFKETPLYKQWYLNQWVVDADKLCYKFDEKKNLYTELPPLDPQGWTYVLGVDLGWEDDTAFVLSAFHANLDKLFIVDSFNKKFMTLPQVELKIKEYMNGKRPPSRIIIDGSAKQSIETMRTRTQIPFEFADKLGKESFIELLNSDLIQEKIKIHYTLSPLINEMMSLVWQTEGDKVKIPKKEHPALPNHLCDAMLYNWRMSFHYHAEPATKVIPIGSKDWYQQQSEEIWEREREQLEKLEGESGDWPSDAGGFGGAW